jgi:hypothetical protein
MARDRQATPDPGELHGVGRSLKRVFTPDPPIHPELVALIRSADGKYGPDEAADERAEQLLKRLKRLPWGDERRASSLA